MIYLASDHAGFELKEKIKIYLSELGHEVIDKGAFSFNKEDDYPDFIRPVAEAVARDKASRGIIFGGSGQGEAICANRVRGVRAAVFYGPILAQGAIDVSGKKSDDRFEIVKLSRVHNNANILSIGFRFVEEEDIKKAIRIWLETDFLNEARHVRRIEKIN
jgi:ribose 5-phosphate isomerase B